MGFYFPWPQTTSQWYIAFGPQFGLDIFNLGFTPGCPTQSVSAWKGVSSVDAWHATSLDIDEILCNGIGHMFTFLWLM